MKKIEKLYVVLTDSDTGNETIASLGLAGGFLQAVSSEKRIIEMALNKLKELLPGTNFWIQEFIKNDKI